MNDYIYFKLKSHPDGSWINGWNGRMLDPYKIYKISCGDGTILTHALNVIFLTKVDVLIAIGKGTVVEELTY